LKKNEHIPLEVSIHVESDSEIYFSFTADEICTTEIEVFHFGERIGSTFVEICDPLPEEAFIWTQDMIQAEMLADIKREEEERLKREQERLEREMEERLRKEEEDRKKMQQEKEEEEEGRRNEEVGGGEKKASCREKSKRRTKMPRDALRCPS